MPTHVPVPQFAAPQLHARFARRFPLVRALTIVFLFLLPMQMRAGAADPHPHALLQLVIDAGDGAIDHHDGDHADAEHADVHAEATSAGGASDPDIPTFEESSSRAMGSVAILAAVVILFAVPGSGAARSWPLQSLRCGELLAPEPPPPRISSV